MRDWTFAYLSYLRSIFASLGARATGSLIFSLGGERNAIVFVNKQQIIIEMIRIL
jgi:hypothetical protein